MLRCDTSSHIFVSKKQNAPALYSTTFLLTETWNNVTEYPGFETVAMFLRSTKKIDRKRFHVVAGEFSPYLRLHL